MYNNHDEEYGVSDLDEDIKHREELIDEIKNIPVDAQWNDVVKDITDIKRRWKRIPYWDSAYEDTLSETFDQYIDMFYAKRKEGYQSNQTLKQELIDKAKQLSTSNEFTQATNEMNELMNQWKVIGTSGKESDDALWGAFNDARQTFFDRKHQHWQDLQTKFSNALEVKQELIKEAQKLANSTEFQKTGERFKEMMDTWKGAGSTGREQEDQLWKEFQTHRQTFYDARSSYYDELHGQQQTRYEEKCKLIEQAKAIANAKEYTKEHSEQMKALSAQWKEVGSCGKDKEDEAWKAFREAMDAYFQGLRQYNEQKHLKWRQNMQEARNRKQDLILKQKQQIKYMRDEMVGLLGQRAIDDMEDQIADKEEFIKELEVQLADIDKTLRQ